MQACRTRVQGSGHYRALVDLMGHAHTGGKTLLCLIDGLYPGVHPIEHIPRKFSTPPFNGQWASSLLASQDPVAIDSVALDFLRAEWNDYPHMSGADDYLHEAALADNPPSGTFYDPDHATRRLAWPALESMSTGTRRKSNTAETWASQRASNWWAPAWAPLSLSGNSQRGKACQRVDTFFPVSLYPWPNPATPSPQCRPFRFCAETVLTAGPYLLRPRHPQDQRRWSLRSVRTRQPQALSAAQPVNIRHHRSPRPKLQLDLFGITAAHVEAIEVKRRAQLLHGLM